MQIEEADFQETHLAAMLRSGESSSQLSLSHRPAAQMEASGCTRWAPSGHWHSGTAAPGGMPSLACSGRPHGQPCSWSRMLHLPFMSGTSCRVTWALWPHSPSLQTGEWSKDRSGKQMVQSPCFFLKFYILLNSPVCVAGEGISLSFCKEEGKSGQSQVTAWKNIRGILIIAGKKLGFEFISFEY